MKMIDVNILISALHTDSPHHEAVRDWLEQAIADDEPLGISEAVCASFIRIVTHRRVFASPIPLDVALELITTIRETEGTTIVGAGPAYWDAFSRLCIDADAHGNLVADAAHAALAIESGATWYSLDRDFARFPGLRWKSPID